jgi:hypothetical protein
MPPVHQKPPAVQRYRVPPGSDAPDASIRDGTRARRAKTQELMIVLDHGHVATARSAPA